jgi:type I protein arginine methyltransferase
MYSVMSYGHMAADGVRMDAYARAIARAVTPGSVVVDLGAGTGILSLLAAKAGARKVYAVDTNPAVLLLRELAAENDLGDRIEVHDKSSLELTLPEKADVIVSDLRGSTPLHEEHFALIRDARERLLRPGGVLVPAQDRLMVAMVESSKLTRDLDLAVAGFTRRGLSARAARTSMANTVFADCSSELSASHILSTSARWATLDYATVEPGVVEGGAELSIQRGGLANALAVWFDTTVHDGLGYSTGPGHSSVYTRTLLPLLEPLEVAADERVHVTVRAHSRGDRWAWETTLVDRDGTTKARQRQATFLGMPTSPDALLRAATTFTPARNALGDRVARILAAMDGSRAVAEIADLVSADTLLARDALLDEVRDAVSRYGR